MRKEFFLSLVGLTVSLTGIITVSSCSKDEFFGIEDVSCIDSQRMHEIAESDLYFDYQKEFLLMAQELSELDSTKRGRVVITDGDTIFENVHIYSFDKVNELFDSLLKSYPELKNADHADLKEIQAIALSNNSSLRRMVSKSAKVKRTKGDNYGYTNKAIEWINSLSNSSNPTSGSTYYSVGSIEEEGKTYYYTFELIPCVTVGDAMNMAVIWSANHEGVEVGGFGWSDSGLMMYCEQATECECNEAGLVCTSPFLPASAGSPNPLMDFHVHPIGWLLPSDADMAWWSTSPETTIHYIISPNFEVAVW